MMNHKNLGPIALLLVAIGILATISARLNVSLPRWALLDAQALRYIGLILIALYFWRTWKAGFGRFAAAALGISALLGAAVTLSTFWG